MDIELRRAVLIAALNAVILLTNPSHDKHNISKVSHAGGGVLPTLTSNGQSQLAV